MMIKIRYAKNIINFFLIFVKHVIKICVIFVKKNILIIIFFNLSEIKIEKDDFIKIKEDLVNAIEKFRNKNIINIEKFNKSLNLLDLYYNKNDNMIIHYDKINYIKLQN